MTAPNNASEAAGRFRDIASRFCSLVDTASSMNREFLLLELYSVLPKLTDAAIELPKVELPDGDDPVPGKGDMRASIRQRQEEWSVLYKSLKEKLADWDLYHCVFDPTKDNEVIFGSLADDIADIYRDLNVGLILCEMQPAQAIFEWRFLFHSHWGQHAMDALRTIHFRMCDVL